MKVEQTNFVTPLIITAVLEADLEIRWGGGGGLQKKIFMPFGSQFGLKIGEAGPSPGSATVQYNCILLIISEPVC